MHLNNSTIDTGTVNKRKTEKTNKNTEACTDLVYEWTDNNTHVTVTILVGAGNDKSNVIVDSKKGSLKVTLPDNRSFFTELYDIVDVSSTSTSYHLTKCIVKLTKENAGVKWPSLNPPKQVHGKSVSPLRDTDSNNKDVDNDVMEPMENGDVLSTKEILPAPPIKTDFIEFDAEPHITLFLYIKNIKNVVKVIYEKDSLEVIYDIGDEKLYRYKTDLVGHIIPSQCSHFMKSSLNMEIKLRKTEIKKWGSCTPITPKDQGDDAPVKNKWFTPGANNIPPAPPAPPNNETKKPTCLVSPVSKTARTSHNMMSLVPSPQSNSVESRGLTGLDNIGNTCFMNSVLQCLINTTELRDYFMDPNLQQCINKENPLGMGGKLALSFGALMKQLWQSNQRSHAPTRLKSVMSIKASQFSGFAQHDAQEFMVELLDGLHEDLNRIKKKPYIAEPPDFDDWSFEDAANESWKLHKMRNDSIIDDLFKGQFKSTLKCHECSKVSVKFDEFCCLSVPIPKDQKVIQVTFFWKDVQTKPKKYYIKVNADAIVEDLRSKLSECTNVQPGCMQIVEVLKSKIHKIFSKNDSLSPIDVTDCIMAFEIYTEQQVGEPVVEIAVSQRMLTTPNSITKCSGCGAGCGLDSRKHKLRRCTKCYRASYCDATCQKNHWPSHKNHCKLIPEPVGLPFIISMPESHATYQNITAKMEAYSRYSVDVFQPPVTQRTESTNYRGSTSSCEMSNDEAEDMDVDSEGSDSSDGSTKADGPSSKSTQDLLNSWMKVRDCQSLSSDEDNCWATSARDGMNALSDDTTLAKDPWASSAKDVENSASNWKKDWPADGATGSSEAAGGCSSNSSSGEDIPQLSSSPSIRAVQPRLGIQVAPGRRLFTIRPCKSRMHNAPLNDDDVLTDKGDEPLDLKDKYSIAMDWRTNEKLPVYCIVQTKELDCEVEGTPTVQRNRETSLDACINLFTQPENLSEGDSWRCPRCKKPVEATKQMSVWRLPTVLIIQLKRFSFKYVYSSDKIDKFVSYPVRGLDMLKYMSTKPTDGPAIYDLYGVINHMGRLLGGHYTSYARTVDPNDTSSSEIDWRSFDDSRVHFVANESRIVNDQAYLLLYRRRNFPFTIPQPIAPPATPTVPSSEENEDEPAGSAASPAFAVDDAGEITPMSISTNSQPSTSSAEQDEPLIGEAIST